MSINSNSSIAASARRRLAALALLVAACAPCWADALPRTIAEERAWHAIGEGEARWWGVKLYDATLWAEQPRFDWARPFVLALRYARNFERAELVDASLDEIERMMDRPISLPAGWREALSGALADVRAGDRLVGVFRPGIGADFFFGDQALGRIEDPELARRFFAIWLDRGTRLPGLRERLIAGAREG